MRSSCVQTLDWLCLCGCLLINAILSILPLVLCSFQCFCIRFDVYKAAVGVEGI